MLVMCVRVERTPCISGRSGGKPDKPPRLRTAWDCTRAKLAGLACRLEQALTGGQLVIFGEVTGPLRHAQDGGVLLVATTRENVSPSLVLELLRRIGGIIKVRQ